jgi:hypothetical protein
MDLLPRLTLPSLLFHTSVTLAIIIANIEKGTINLSQGSHRSPCFFARTAPMSNLLPRRKAHSSRWGESYWSKHLRRRCIWSWLPLRRMLGCRWVHSDSRIVVFFLGWWLAQLTVYSLWLWFFWDVRRRSKWDIDKLHWFWRRQSISSRVSELLNYIDSILYRLREFYRIITDWFVFLLISYYWVGYYILANTSSEWRRDWSS